MKNLKSKFYIAFFACILVMGIGYAAISTNLRINGTAQISSNFDIYISSITEKTVNQAKTVTAEVAGKTTANFDVQLEKPGSYAEYEVTVKNDGNLDAVLKAVNGIDEANAKAPTDIKYSIKDLEENTSLLMGEEVTFIVRAEFKSTATTVPTSNKQLTLWLDFEQSSGEITPPVKGENAITLIQSKNVVGNTDGLSTDATIDHNTRYIGANTEVKNYVTFNNETWRIIGILEGKVKIVKNSSIGKMGYSDVNGVHNWPTSTLSAHLNGQYYNSMTATAKKMVSDTTYYLGVVEYQSGKNYTTLLNVDVYSEERGNKTYNCTVGSNGETSATCPRATRWTGKIGLMYVSDYPHANKYWNNDYSRVLGNWIKELNPSDYDFVWFINHSTSPAGFVGWNHSNSYSISSGSDAITSVKMNVHPVLYLDSNVKITDGDGSSGNPYQLSM